MTIVVPQFAELNSKNIYLKIKGYILEIINYFPEYEDSKDYIPPKQFMWDIFCTHNQEMANRFVSHSLNQWSKHEGNEDKTIEVTEDVLNQLHGANYFSKKKGKALFMLKAGKKYGVVQRKRKK